MNNKRYNRVFCIYTFDKLNQLKISQTNKRDNTKV